MIFSKETQKNSAGRKILLVNKKSKLKKYTVVTEIATPDRKLADSE